MLVNDLELARSIIDCKDIAEYVKEKKSDYRIPKSLLVDLCDSVESKMTHLTEFMSTLCEVMSSNFNRLHVKLIVIENLCQNLNAPMFGGNMFESELANMFGNAEFEEEEPLLHIPSPVDDPLFMFDEEMLVELASDAGN